MVEELEKVKRIDAMLDKALLPETSKELTNILNKRISLLLGDTPELLYYIAHYYEKQITKMLLRQEALSVIVGELLDSSIQYGGQLLKENTLNKLNKK